MPGEIIDLFLGSEGLSGKVIAFLTTYGISEAIAALLVLLLALLLILAIAGALRYLTHRLVSGIIGSWTASTRSHWDDLLMKWHVFRRGADLVPLLFLYLALPRLFGPETAAASLTVLLLKILLVYLILMLSDSILNAALEALTQSELSGKLPVLAIIQTLKILIYFLAIISVMAMILNKDPLVLLSGLGAMTAVLMLIFKDAILGFVAGIQLLQNRMVREGDWIEMPRYQADGDVIEIALTTIKVQNWDKTITNIPAYALISDSFKNWRGMQESGGRRIKRSIHIDMKSIRFCDLQMLERFRRITFISEYITAKQQEIEEDNNQKKVDLSSLANGRRLTNIGIFRHYAETYLKNHPRINKKLILMVRQLSPGPVGLPIEIYAFADVTDWGEYEQIQADIFDHLLAVIKEFDLKLYQDPSGEDIAGLAL